MKYIVTFSLLFLLASSSFGQTELWRISGNYPVAIPGDNNCIYLTHGGFEPKDTIKKVNSAGEIVWQTPMLRRGQLSFNGSGLYTSIGSLVDYSDSVAFYDLLGNVSWYFNTNGRALSSRLATDAGGNLFLLVETNSGQTTLMKVNASGTKLFQSPILPPVLRNYVDYFFYDGPFVDNTGKVWVVGYFQTQVMSATLEKDDGYLYLYQFDGTSGNLLLQKKILMENYYQDKTDARGNNSFLKMDYPYLQSFGLSNGRLVLYGQCSWIKSNTPASRIGKVEQLSEWRLMVIEQTGKGKMFKYKGKGLLSCSTSNPKSKDDWQYNIPNSVSAGAGDAIYLTGGIATRPEGDYCTGVGDNLHCDAALMRFNTATKKPMWINNKAFLDKGSDMMIAVTKSEKLLVWMGGTTLNIYDYNGNVGSTVLNFPDPYVLFPEYSALNAIEDNVLYLRTQGPFYFVKYSLPPVTIMPGTLPRYQEEMPAVFALDQNYPNPFNPTTTISYTLQWTSFVTLKVYNMLGQEVATLVNHEIMDEGVQDVDYDASSLTSGAYFYRLTAEEITNEEDGTVGKIVTSVKKMILVK